MEFSLPLELRSQRGQTYIFIVFSHYVNILAFSWFFYSACITTLLSLKWVGFS